MKRGGEIIVPAGVTPGGLPYPEDNEQVLLGAQAIKALALAIEAEPWCNLVRWTSGVLGAAADAPIGVWDFSEGNFALGDSNNQGFVAPKGGLWQVSLVVHYVATWPAGTTNQMSAGIKTSAVPPREIYEQRYEPQSGSNQRRSYNVAGLLRVAAGERCWAFMNNYSSINGVTHSAGNAPGDRGATRFSARWVAP